MHMTDSLRAGAATHVGLVRSNNEDAIGDVPGQGLYIVADGIGGEACGELASAIAVASVERMVAQGASLQKAIIAAEQAIAGAVSSGQGRAGMGTTIVVLQFKGNNFRLAWMGDSGNAEGTSPHVHFEMHTPDGTPYSPYVSLRLAQGKPEAGLCRFPSNPRAVPDAARNRGYWAVDHPGFR